MAQSAVAAQLIVQSAAVIVGSHGRAGISQEDLQSLHSEDIRQAPVLCIGDSGDRPSPHFLPHVSYPL